MIYETLASLIYNGEYQIALANQAEEFEDFEDFIALLDGQRSEKNYDWQSDIHLPESESHIFTQTSLDVGQYFTTRDFVEVYLEDEKGVPQAAAAKECINRTLNRRDLYHYAKFVRAKQMATIAGRVYLKCWWEKESHEDVVGVREVPDVNEYGQMTTRLEPVTGKVVDKDQFNYDVWDQRNVFTDDTFCYSLQQKKWIIFRSEMTTNEILEIAEENGYFNLDELKELAAPDKTETARQTYDKEKNFNPIRSSLEKPFDVLERYGKFWTVCDEDENGPVLGTEKIGIDENGEPLKNAKMRHVIITIVTNGQKHLVIGFRLTPYIDAQNKPYIPAIRALCYIHPVYDNGMGDGKYIRELQVAIDDTFNISQDRVMLSTLPTFKTKKTTIDDNSTLYFAPGHPMEVNDPNDVVEFRMTDNIQGALQQIATLRGMMQQVDAIQPPSMGNLPAMTSTTATAVATAAQGTTTRNQYKSLTFEYTGLTELYWMILQMTYRFAEPETGLKLMGEKVYDFDPTKNFYYKPVSQSIETEQSKALKIKNWIQMLGYVAQIQHPDTVKIVDNILMKVSKLMGDEYYSFAGKYLNPNIPIQGASQGQVQGIPASNQNGVPMSPAEITTREGANANYGGG